MVRHGEIPSNLNKVYAGRSAEKLTSKGVTQAEEVAEKIKPHNLDELYSSPIARALQTAEIITGRIGKDILIDDSFRELEMGPWEGMSESDISRLYPYEWHIWNTKPAELMLPGRETLDALLKRVLTGVQDICGKAENRNVVIVTHVAIIRVLLLWHAKKNLNLYKTIHVPNAEIFQIRISSFRCR